MVIHLIINREKMKETKLRRYGNPFYCGTLLASQAYSRNVFAKEYTEYIDGYMD